ncbi:MAG TPA: YbhB/YbcL family Raf kinase inhibitor-like protein, partial [Verrucomicrobiae bacterium]|nr:YbhB/YbcL family Raf kinase inhibitor-like protein [Verrucomicrobiae bacterium]
MNARMSFSLAAAWFCLAAASCANDTKNTKEPVMSIQVTCAAFADGQPIPDKFTCTGVNLSPPLQWTNVPLGVKSFALIADDPDAPMGTWVHWVLYNLPPTANALAENTPPAPELPDGS